MDSAGEKAREGGDGVTCCAARCARVHGRRCVGGRASVGPGLCMDVRIRVCHRRGLPLCVCVTRSHQRAGLRPGSKCAKCCRCQVQCPGDVSDCHCAKRCRGRSATSCHPERWAGEGGDRGGREAWGSSGASGAPSPFRWTPPPRPGSRSPRLGPGTPRSPPAFLLWREWGPVPARGRRRCGGARSLSLVPPAASAPVPPLGEARGALLGRGLQPGLLGGRASPRGTARPGQGQPGADRVSASPLLPQIPAPGPRPARH